MKNSPDVTVAIPCLNQGRFLDSALRSIFSQGLEVEAIVVDGGSTDDSLSVIGQWRDRLAWFRSGTDNGQSAAINEAIKHSHAPLVCWLNADDLYMPGGLAVLVEAMNSDSLTDVVYGNCKEIDALGNPIGRAKSRRFTLRALSRGNPVPQPASMIRRNAWEKVGGLDESLHFSLDYDLWWRLHRGGARFKRIGTVVAAARTHEDAKSVAFAGKQYAEAKTIISRHYGSVPRLWKLREPLSVAGRTGNMPLKYLTRSWRTWTRW